MSEKAKPSTRPSERNVRGTFHRVQIFSTMEAAHYSHTAAQAAAILQKRDAISERAQAHFAKHEKRWVDQEMAKRLKTTPAPALSPPGSAASRRSAIRHEAEAQVFTRYIGRLGRISDAADRMIAYVQTSRRSVELGR